MSSKSGIEVLYKKFSGSQYKAEFFWTTNRGFESTTLYHNPKTDFIPNADPTIQEFVQDRSLEPAQDVAQIDTKRAAELNMVPPPGIEPGSSDFQSGA